ncbi:MAG: translation initiation factor IF-2 subunit alpha [Candidatus ainarchaeum sp.]|nr:translation initiation factor IF-2 subunit alpha [Candidatus ainarchaeum sp.]
MARETGQQAKPAAGGAAKAGLPELDSLTIATVRKIMPYGAFCTLDEYGNREAFIHVSEVASRWVKNIHEFLKEGQKIVARVHRVTPEKDQVDLSLRRVTEADKKLKMEAYKREKRVAKLFELCAKKTKTEIAKAHASVGSALLSKYPDLYSALEAISFNGEAAFEGLAIPGDWKKALSEVAVANIHRPEVVITETAMVTVYLPDAIDVIKAAFKDAVAVGKGEAEVTAHYIGAPRYRLSVKAGEYKAAEKALEEANAAVIRRVKSAGVVEFEREGANPK